MSTNQEILTALLDAQQMGTAVALATIVQARGSVPRHAGAKMLIYEDGRFLGTIGGGEMEALALAEANIALQEDQPRMLTYSLVDPQAGDPGLCGGQVEIYVEPYLPPLTLLVVGCGHVGQALAQLAHWLGFRVAVYDDRPELATPDVIPDADVYLPGHIEDALAQFTVTRNTYVTAVTRNVNLDRQILPHLAATATPYIGVMGSRRRWEHTKKRLREDGLTDADLAKFHSPLGLELNAETPQEIALSILAEIIMLRRGGDGSRMGAARTRSDAI